MSTLSRFNDEIWNELGFTDSKIYWRDFILALSDRSNDPIIDKVVEKYHSLSRLIEFVCLYGSSTLLQRLLSITSKYKYDFIINACRRKDDNPEILALVMNKIDKYFNWYTHVY
jgi:hypothetical protein